MEERTNDIYNSTLWAGVKNLYSGANIPGKKVEALNWYVVPVSSVNFRSTDQIVSRIGGFPEY